VPTLSSLSFLVLTALLGIAGWLVMKARLDRERALGAAQLQSDLAVARAHAEESAHRQADLAAELAARTEHVRELQDALGASRQDRARLEAEVAAERRGAAEKLTVVAEAEARMRDAFSALSSDALRRNNQSFLELARSSLGEFQQTARVEMVGRYKAIEELVQPLKESLSLVDGKLQLVEQNRVGTQSAITEQLKSLHAAQQTLQVETGRLVQALRSPNVRGPVGRACSPPASSAAGMLEYCDFDLKESAGQ
jgi:DNA recombination protein RmuC